MAEPQPRRSLSPIARWMIAIAAIAVTLGLMVVSPFVFVVAVFVLMEALAVVRFRESLRRGPMPPWKQLLWVLAFLVVIPIVSIVSALVALYVYCSVNPNALP